MSDIDWKSREESWERTVNALSRPLRMQFAERAFGVVLTSLYPDELKNPTLRKKLFRNCAKMAFEAADALLEEAKK